MEPYPVENLAEVAHLEDWKLVAFAHQFLRGTARKDYPRGCEEAKKLVEKMTLESLAAHLDYLPSRH
jgi:hypothetical protein